MYVMYVPIYLTVCFLHDLRGLRELLDLPDLTELHTSSTNLR